MPLSSLTSQPSPNHGVILSQKGSHTVPFFVIFAFLVLLNLKVCTACAS
jgi:hypothetical protein